MVSACPQNCFYGSGSRQIMDDQIDCGHVSMLERQGIFPQEVYKQKEAKDYNGPEDKKRVFRGTDRFWRPPPFQMPSVPSLVISEDNTGPFISSTSNLELTDGKVIRDNLWMSDSRYYNENRGPILRVVGSKKEVVLTFKEFMKLDKEGIPVDDQHEDFSDHYPVVEDQFVRDDMGQFSVTTKCKQIKAITLKNEGTTAVRYQWLRAPPTRAMRKILGRPGCILNLRKLEPPKDPFFFKDTTFEFHFRELPGILLPGQSFQFPIIFRPHRNGYFYENLYLLTHPRLSDGEDRIFHLRLYGIAMDPDCTSTAAEVQTNQKKARELTVENIKDRIQRKMKHHEAMDIVNAILDSVLYAVKSPKSTLPNGKVTAEKIFYTHNPSLIYRFGYAERALEDSRQLLSLLVPKSRIIDNDEICPLSIRRIYMKILHEPPPEGYFKDNLMSDRTEELFADLAGNTKQLLKERVFGWPSLDRILYSSCYNTMVSMMDDIMFRIANIDLDSKNHALNHVLRSEVREKLRKTKMKELGVRVGRLKNDDSRDPADPDPSRDSSQFFVYQNAFRHSKASIDTLWTTRASGNAQAVDPESAGYENIVRASVVDQSDNVTTYVDEEEEEEEEEGEDSPGLEAQVEFLGEDLGRLGQQSFVDIEDEEVEAEYHRMKKQMEEQAKRILFETLFGCGVERMMSVVDAHRAMVPYAEPESIRCGQQTCSKH